MKTRTIQVRSLDVWGHGPEDCHKYGCPCMGEPCDLDTHNHEDGACAPAHDENRCQCTFEISDMFRAGSFQVQATACGDFTDEALHTALIDRGYLKASVALTDVRFEEDSGGFEDGACTVADAKTGEPIYVLEWENETT